MQASIVVSTGSTAAEVVTSVFTAIGALATVVASFLAIKLWRADVRKGRRAQASGIHGYKDGGVCVVENNSAGAVYGVRILRTALPDVELAAIIPINSKASAAVGDGAAEQRGRKIPITFSFTDQDDVRWKRQRDGGLVEESPAVGGGGR